MYYICINKYYLTPAIIINMTTSMKANIEKEFALKRIKQNEQKRKKWKKASSWLREQMLDWEIKYGETQEN